MAKTRRLIKESLPFVDLVTEIVDARIPLSSSNPELAEMIGNKPRIVLLNKCDVADEKATARWVEYYKGRGCSHRQDRHQKGNSAQYLATMESTVPPAESRLIILPEFSP